MLHSNFSIRKCNPLCAWSSQICAARTQMASKYTSASLWRNIPEKFSLFSDNRYSHNHYCLQRRAAELARASSQALPAVGFWRLQHVRGEDDSREMLWFSSYVKALKGHTCCENHSGYINPNPKSRPGKNCNHCTGNFFFSGIWHCCV